jgi:hypothetical protein
MVGPAVTKVPGGPVQPQPVIAGVAALGAGPAGRAGDLSGARADFGHFSPGATGGFTGPMRGSVFVADERPLDLSLGAAQIRLESLARHGRLDEASRAAYESGFDHLLRVGPLGGVPGASRLVRVQFVEPVYREGVMTLGVRWEATGFTGGLFPVLDANLSLGGGGGHGARLALTAAYRPPLGGLGAELDRLLLHRVAAGTVRAFLASLAGALEGAPQAAVETAAPAWWPPGPEPAPS